MRPSPEVHELHVEHERRIGRDDTARPAGAVPQLRRNDEPPLAALLHAHDTLIPARNHTAFAERKTERLVAIEGAVELLSFLFGRRFGVQPAGVVNDRRLPRFDGWA